MIEDFIISAIPTFSDDEDMEHHGLSVSSLKVSSRCPSVYSVVVAAKPSSVAISHLVDRDNSEPIYRDGAAIGSMAVRGEVCFLLLEKELLFDIHDLCEAYQEVIVLDSRQGPADAVGVLSTMQDDPRAIGSKMVRSGVTGMAAFLATSARIKGLKGVIFLNEHRPIRVTLGSLFVLSENVCKALDLAAPKADVLSGEFKKTVPINSRVPLYT
jgi:hypothetical protein